MTVAENEVNDYTESLGGEVSDEDFTKNDGEVLENELSEEEPDQFEDRPEDNDASGDVESAFENGPSQAADNDDTEQVADAFDGSTAFDTDSGIQPEQAQPVPDAVQNDGVVHAKSTADGSEAGANAVGSAFETVAGAEVDKAAGSQPDTAKTGDSSDQSAVGDAFLDSGEWSVEKAEADPKSELLEKVDALSKVLDAATLKDYFRSSDDDLATQQKILDAIAGENFKHDMGSLLDCFEALRSTGADDDLTIAQIMSEARVLADTVFADGNPADYDTIVLADVYMAYKAQAGNDLSSNTLAKESVAITRAIAKHYSAEKPFSGDFAACVELFALEKNNSGLAQGNIDGAAELAAIASGIENEEAKDALIDHLKAKARKVEDQLQLASFIQYYDRLEPLEIPSISSATDDDSLAEIEKQRTAARAREQLISRVNDTIKDGTLMDSLAQTIENDFVNLDKEEITDSYFTTLMDKVKTINQINVDATGLDIGDEYHQALDKYLSRNRRFPDAQKKVIDFIKAHDNFSELMDSYFKFYDRSITDYNFDFEVAIDCIPIVQERLEQAQQLKEQLSNADAELFDFYDRNQTDPYQRRDHIEYIYENRKTFSENFAKCVEAFGKTRPSTTSEDFIWEYTRILHLMKVMDKHEYTGIQNIHQGFDEQQVIAINIPDAADSVSLLSHTPMIMKGGDGSPTQVEQFDQAMQAATWRLANRDYNAFPESGLGKLIADAEYANSRLASIKKAEAAMDDSIFAPEQTLTFETIADAVNAANGDHQIKADELGANGIRRPTDLESYVNARLIKEVYQNDAFAGLRETEAFKSFDETNALKKMFKEHEEILKNEKEIFGTLLREPTFEKYIDEFTSSILKDETLLSGNDGAWKAELTKLRRQHALEVVDTMYRAPQKRCDAITTKSLDTMIYDAGINYSQYSKPNYKTFFARMDGQAFADYADFNGNLWKLKNPLASMKDAYSRNVGEVGGYLELPHYSSYMQGRMDKLLSDYYQQNKKRLFTFTEKELADMGDEQLVGMTNEALGSMNAEALANMTDEQHIAVFKQDPVVMTQPEFMVMAMQDSSSTLAGVVNYQAYRQTKLILIKQELEALGGDLDSLGSAVNNDGIDLGVLQTAHDMDAAKEDLHEAFMKRISR